MGYECKIDDFATICPHSTVCSQTIVGEGAKICAGSVVVQCTKIGRWAMYGAGTLCMHDVGDGEVVIGQDQHFIKNNPISRRG